MTGSEETGVVKGIDEKNDPYRGTKLRYKVELESGCVVLVNEKLITPLLESQLEIGSCLRVRLNGSHVLGAEICRPTSQSPVMENKPFTATVESFESEKGLLIVRGPENRRITLRLPVSYPIWNSLQVNKQIYIIPTTYAGGKPTYKIRLPDSMPSQPGAEEQPAPQKKPKRTSQKKREAPQEPTSRPPEPVGVSVEPPQTAPVPTVLRRGKIAQILPYYLVIDLDDGEQVNGLITQWPRHAVLPYVGMEVTCRCVLEHREITEFLNIGSDSADMSVNVAVAGYSFGFDREYFEERQREKHRHGIMAFIKEHGEQGHIEWYQMRPSMPPRYQDPLTPLSIDLKTAIRSAEPDFQRFFLHQARALDSIRAGRNVVLVTPTASGKTLAYNPAVFETLGLPENHSHALYVFPLNALRSDQVSKAESLAEQLCLRGISVTVQSLERGMRPEARRRVSEANPHLLCVNPEFLSVMLQDYERGLWKEFFGGLRYVLLDEVHTYRGLLGMHAAGLIRRLLLLTRRLQAKPQFILCSATVNNPSDLAVRLTSLPASSFDVLAERDDGSAQNAKHWVSFRPDIESKRGDYNGYLETAAMVMVDLLCSKDQMGRPAPLNTVLFAKSKRDVDTVYQIVKQNLLKRRSDLVSKVHRFVAATLEPEKKRDIYEGLRNGTYVGVVSTNALEAGIDIGRLDACVIAGFPFTVMRLRQMAGRVGRKNEGIVVFVPHPAKAVDEYYRYNPELLLTQPPEAFVLDAGNHYIARKHLNASAYELKGITLEEAAIFGEHYQKIINEATNKSVMYRIGNRVMGKKRDFNNLQDPYAIQNIRSAAQVPFAICPKANMSCTETRCLSGDGKKCKSLIAIIDRQYVYRDCHPGAIYEAPDGKFYRIESLDEQRRVALAQELPDNTPNRTRVIENLRVEITERTASRKNLLNDAIIEWGGMRITREFSGYQSYTLEPARRCRRCHIELDETIDSCPKCGRPTETFFRESSPKYMDFPIPYHNRGFQITLETMGAWMTVPAQLESRLMDASPCKLPGDKNKLQESLRAVLTLDRLPESLHLTGLEIAILGAYYRKASRVLNARVDRRKQILVFPGTYGQCLLKALRSELPEERALEIFEGLTGYPVTSKLNHVCRKCQTSVLLPAMHAVEHAVTMRYPSVALGDQSDVGSYTTLGHETTVSPTMFWFDAYEGGSGAAEKIFEQIEALLEAGWTTLLSCVCSTLEGCPYCTQLSSCSQHGTPVSKLGALHLIALLLGKEVPEEFWPFIYRSGYKKDSDAEYAKNEYATRDHGVGPESPVSNIEPDAYDLLRIQKLVHEPVLHKAFSVRSAEISSEVPPVSAVDLNEALHYVLSLGEFPQDWHITRDMGPYEVLEIKSSASLRMVKEIFRLFARTLHPDVNPDNSEWANEMMKLVNRAYEHITNERKS